MRKLLFIDNIEKYGGFEMEYQEDINIKIVKYLIEKILNKKEKNIYILRLQNYKIKEIAKKCKMSESCIYKTIKNVTLKLKKEIEICDKYVEIIK